MKITNTNHLALLKRSMTGNWNDEDKQATADSLQVFDGVEAARAFFQERMERKWKCCICGCDFWDRTGCNPDPIVAITEDGNMPVCCPTCNNRFVMPARLGLKPGELVFAPIGKID